MGTYSKEEFIDRVNTVLKKTERIKLKLAVLKSEEDKLRGSLEDNNINLDELEHEKEKFINKRRMVEKRINTLFDKVDKELREMEKKLHGYK